MAPAPLGGLRAVRTRSHRGTERRAGAGRVQGQGRGSPGLGLHGAQPACHLLSQGGRWGQKTNTSSSNSFSYNRVRWEPRPRPHSCPRGGSFSPSADGAPSGARRGGLGHSAPRPAWWSRFRTPEELQPLLPVSGGALHPPWAPTPGQCISGRRLPRRSPGPWGLVPRRAACTTAQSRTVPAPQGTGCCWGPEGVTQIRQPPPAPPAPRAPENRSGGGT